MGIEPTYLAWKASVLPLNYTRKGIIYKENDCPNKQSSVGVTGFEPAASWSQIKRSSQAEPHPVSGYFVIPFASLIRDARPIILHKYHSVNNFFKFLQDSFFLFYFPMQKSFGWFFSRRELHSFSTLRPLLSKHRLRLPPRQPPMLSANVHSLFSENLCLPQQIKLILRTFSWTLYKIPIL